MVVDQEIARAGLGHGHGQATVGVFEAGRQRARAVVDRQEPGAALPELLFDDRAADLLGDAPAERIVGVFYHVAARQVHLQQFARVTPAVDLGMGL